MIICKEKTLLNLFNIGISEVWSPLLPKQNEKKWKSRLYNHYSALLFDIWHVILLIKGKEL